MPSDISPVTPNPPRNAIDRRFCIAPMMDWSDKHCRYFWRLISHHAVLYTEMVTTGALIHGDTERFLDYHKSEHPVAIQLGGSDPKALAQCAKLAEKWQYDEVNLNCGCPSDRVQSGRFGACLMAEPELVADCIKAMQDVVSIPVTVKHRIGIDEMEDYHELTRFVDTIAKTGCNTFIVHARKAWLKGLSPKQNREIPPLRYDWVYQLKIDFPQLEMIINGGITDIEQCQQHLAHVDGVMVGRETYSNPYMLAAVDAAIYQDHRAAPSRLEILNNFLQYVEAEMEKGTRLNHMSRHILGLCQGIPGARRFRRHISENAHKPGAGIDVLHDAMNLLS